MKGFRDIARGLHKNWFFGECSPVLRLMSFLLLLLSMLFFAFEKKKDNKG